MVATFVVDAAVLWRELGEDRANPMIWEGEEPAQGVFLGASAEESYNRMIELVARAEDYLRAEDAWDLPAAPPAEPPTAPLAPALAALRRAVSEQAGFPLLLCSRRDAECLAFARDPELGRIGQQGPVTPDHVIRTKRLPLLGRDLDVYASAYRDYFDRQAPRSRSPVKMLDPAPRVILDPELGLCTLGRSAGAARIVEDIYRHSITSMLRAERLGGYRALPESDIFDVEYWELEQAKLGSASPPPFAGEVALVTGAASGIGKACADAFLARGAAVVGLDRDPAVSQLHQRPDWLGLHCDLTDETALAAALEQAVQRFGGLDMLVLNAGIFEAGTRIEALSGEAWRRTMAINLDANLSLLRECHPLLKLAPRGGRVAVIGSKNLPAPGPGAAAYSASKAGLNQLVRVAALEWAGDGIRLNSVHPDAVFDTGLWTPEVLEARHPVRLLEFRLRRGSGGAGRFRGGDGLVRCYEFLAPLTVSLLTQRRETAPYGLRGGAAGSPGRNAVERRDGLVAQRGPGGPAFTPGVEHVLDAVNAGHRSAGHVELIAPEG